MAKGTTYSGKGKFPTMTKWVFGFGGGKADGSAKMKDLLGGKGANLAEMASLGLPVPPGFTITTEVCSYFYKNGKTYPGELKAQVEAGLAEIAAQRPLSTMLESVPSDSWNHWQRPTGIRN